MPTACRHLHVPTSKFVGVSVVTACMNRNENLLRVLPSWLECAEVKEVVVVDWSSTTPVMETLLSGLPDCTEAGALCWQRKVKLIRVEGQQRWVLSWAFNLAARHATFPWLLKLDCDNLLRHEFLCHHLRLSTESEVFAERSKWFFCGDWRQARNKNENHLNGVILVSRYTFLAVGGYNEYLVRYGWDDSDLYLRLQKGLKMTQLPIDNDLIQHLEHEDVWRASQNTFSDIHYNRFLSARMQWDLQQDGCTFRYWDLSRKEPGHRFWYKHASLTWSPAVPEEEAQRAEEELDRYISVRVGMSDPRDAPKPGFTGKSYLYVHVRNGLGNKLRALASAYTLFHGLNQSRVYNLDRRGWHLVVVWSQDHHCEAAIDQLFTLSSLAKYYPSQITVVKTLPTGSHLRQPLLELADSNLHDEYRSPDVVLHKSMQELLDSVAARVAARQAVHVLVESASVVDSPFKSWASDCQFLRELRPVKDVADLLKQTEDSLPYPLSTMVAVHVRIGQQGTSWDSVDKWSEDKRQQWHHWRSLSTPPTFIAKMKQLREAEPSLKFFVASDTEAAVAELKAAFPPDTVFDMPRTMFDRSVRQVQYGLADAYLLGKCKLFLCSQWSSYTEMVKRLSNLPMLMAGTDF